MRRETLNDQIDALKAASRDYCASFADPVEAAKRLAEIAEQIDPVDLREVARLRMRLMWANYGPACMLVGEWWRWLGISVKG